MSQPFCNDSGARKVYPGKKALRTGCYAALRAAWESDEFQVFNRQRAMHLVDSYRNHEGAKAMIKTSIDTYRMIYKEMGLSQ